MKKILICSLMFATLAFVSCGDKTNKSEVLNDSVMSAMQTMLQENDADGFSAAITQTQQAIEQLVKEGKTEEAQACAKQLQEFITNNAESIKAVAGEDNELVNSVIETITSIPEGIKGDLDDMKETVEDEYNSIKEKAEAERDEYVNGVSGAVEDAKQQAVDAANQVVEDAKQKANDAVEDAKQKVNQAVQDAEQQANDAADKAVEDAQNKANKAVNKAADKIKGKFKKK